MFQDEAGFGRINKPKRCWCPRGIRPSIPCHHIREYRYLYGAVSPADGQLFSLVLPYTNTECMNIFLRVLAKTYLKDEILLVLDNAAWHHSGSLEVPDTIRLYPLLPYTPELNPIEMIWDDIREKGFRNEIFHSLEHVVDRLCISVLSLMNNPARVASITHRSWLLVD